MAKEYEHDWSLPGGGVDHGEEPLDALRRELKEEICVGDFVSATLKGAFSYYFEEREAWLMWLVYDVVVDNAQFACGLDVKEIDFKNIHEFRGSKVRSKFLTYKAVFDLAK